LRQPRRKKALDAKDYATAIAKCNEAKATKDLTDYDNYLIDRFLGVAYFQTNDRVKAEVAFVAVVKNPACPPEDRQNLVGPAIQLASEANNVPLVAELAQIALKQTITNADIYGTIAQSYYGAGDTQNAIVYAQKGIDLATSQGKVPQYAIYQILTYSYDKLKDRANEMKGLTLMARDYGKAEDWTYLLDMSLEMLPAGNKTAREVAALDIYRLRLVVGATWVSSNFLEAADAADAIRAFGDERTFLQMGIAKGVFNQAKVAPTVAKNAADARKDEPVLPLVEKAAKDGKALTSVAEAYYGYGRYADAARVAQAAIAAGGPFAGEAKLVLGMAQARQGNEAAAKQALAGFTGDPALARAAELWNVYLNRQPPAPAAAAK
jgi:dUTPase